MMALTLALVMVACGANNAATPTTTRPVAPITIVETYDLSTDGRVRMSYEAVITDWTDRAVVEELMIELVTALLNDSGADVVALIAWDDVQLVGVTPFNVARAQLSADGKGWDEFGGFLPGSGTDDGSILLQVVTKRDGQYVQGMETRRVATTIEH